LDSELDRESDCIAGCDAVAVEDEGDVDEDDVDVVAALAAPK
jgi:hypothetical protein